MTFKPSPKPLNLNSDLISYPFCNSDPDVSPVQSLLVNICANDPADQAETETISLKFCCMRYYPQYTDWLQKHHSHPMYSKIVDYYDKWIEAPIQFVCECIFESVY